MKLTQPFIELRAKNKSYRYCNNVLQIFLSKVRLGSESKLIGTFYWLPCSWQETDFHLRVAAAPGQGPAHSPQGGYQGEPEEDGGADHSPDTTGWDLRPLMCSVVDQKLFFPDPDPTLNFPSSGSNLYYTV